MLRKEPMTKLPLDDRSNRTRPPNIKTLLGCNLVDSMRQAWLTLWNLGAYDNNLIFEETTVHCYIKRLSTLEPWSKINVVGERCVRYILIVPEEWILAGCIPDLLAALWFSHLHNYYQKVPKRPSRSGQRIWSVCRVMEFRSSINPWSMTVWSTSHVLPTSLHLSKYWPQSNKCILS